MADAMEKLKIKRDANRRAAMVLMQELDVEFTRTPARVIELDDRGTRLTNIEETLNLINERMEELLNLKEYAEELKDVLAYEQKISSYINRVKYMIEQANSCSSMAGSNPSQLRTSSDVSIKLPKLTMATFDGSRTNWQEFWGRFKSAVHDNGNLSKEDKFSYLKAYLVGMAARSIAGLALTERNYDTAIEIIKDRFGNTDLIINEHHKAILDLPRVTKASDVGGLRKLYDLVEVNVRSLSNLDQDPKTYEGLLYTVLMKCIPTEIALLFSRDKDANETDGTSKTAKLVAFLKKEIESREETYAICNPGADDEFKGSFRTRNEHDKGKTSNLYRERSRNNIPSAAALSTVVLNNQCVFCGKPNHKSEDCKRLSKVSERRDYLRKKGRCYICLARYHIARYCKEKEKVCQRCGRAHHVSVCDKEPDVLATEETKLTDKEIIAEKPAQQITQMSSIATNNNFRKILLQTATVIVANNRTGDSLRTRCCIDGGSMRTFIREDLAKALRLCKLDEETLSIHNFMNPRSERITVDRVKVVMKNMRDPSRVVEVEALVVPEICSATIHVPENNVKEHLVKMGLEIADVDVETFGSEAIGILIGAEHKYTVTTGRIERLGEALAAVETVFGWTLHGPTSVVALSVSSQEAAVLTTISTFTEQELTAQVKAFWEIEAIGIKDPEKQSSQIDAEVMKQFEDSIRFQDGRYQVSLPWGDNKDELKDNYDVARRRTNRLFKRFNDNPILQLKYQSVIQEQIDSGIVERVPTETAPKGPVYYMPHREVIKEQRETTKTRIVYDASSHAEGVPSLNDCLRIGPNLNPDVFDLLLRFRMNRIAFIADIEGAFLQITLNPRDRDAVRFLWKTTLDGIKGDTEFEEYRIARVPFGVTSSPFLLAATIRYHLRKNEETYSEICHIMKRDLYVDDLISGENNSNKAYHVSKEAKRILDTAGMNLRKFKTHSKELKRLWNSGNLDIQDNKLEDINSCKVLGLNWNTEMDSLSLDISSLETWLPRMRNTKKGLLQAVAKIYDPLGLVSPFTIVGKIMFQETWERGIGWDTPLPEDLERKFSDWSKEIPKIRTLEIPRYYYYDDVENEKVRNIEYSCFCDASEKCYATVVYLRFKTSSDQVKTIIVASKTRISPLKKISLPRLELMAALLGARLITYVRKSIFPTINIRIRLWTDSMITLGWIRQTAKKYKPFVGNRVAEIQEMTDPEWWHYCPGRDNPADLPSRGRTIEELKYSQVWWEGPIWLRLNESEWPTEPNTSLFDENPEIRKIYQESLQLSCVVQEIIEPLLDYKRFSNYLKLLRTTSWILRFIRNSRKINCQQKGPLTAEELSDGEKILIKEAQSSTYSDELKRLRNGTPVKGDSKIMAFDPILDNDDLICLGGRLQKSNFSYQEKHPWLISDEHPLASLLIRYYHNRTKHAGLSGTLTDMREKFWIPRARRLIKGQIKSCLTCKRFSAPAGEAPVAPLPPDRIQEASPFDVTGVDFAGPLYVKDGPTLFKSYVVIYTCAVTRAIHLELVHNLTTEAFLLAFRRFIARRGISRIVYTELYATTFKRAHIELKEIWNTIRCPEVRDFLTNSQISWKFIMERAAWWGGFWERLVRSVKTALKKTLGRASLNFEEMGTLLTEIEAMINSRPITYVYNDKDEPEPLTPGHFLIGRRITSLPSTKIPNPSKFNTTQRELTKRLKYRQTLLDRLWERWRREYILELRSAHETKPVKETKSIKVNDLVLLSDKVPRLLWKIGRVTSVFIGRNKKIRSCAIKMPNGNVLRRPIQLLHPLEINDTDS